MANSPPIASLSQPPSTLFPLPRKVVWIDPANLGTQDIKQLCRCDDGCEYFVKDGSKHPFVPHAEWFCTHLAELVGISGPPCQILEMPDGTLVFGSRCEGGVIGPQAAAQWWQKIQTGAIPLNDVKGVLTRIYAFDHFVHNTDRHAGNFLAREQRHGYTILAFDYSRSWIYHGFPLPDLPFDENDANERTLKVQRQLRSAIGSYIDRTEARRFLESIKKIPVVNIKTILAQEPNDWLPKQLYIDIMSWWSSKGFYDRLDGIAEGIENGTYL